MSQTKGLLALTALLPLLACGKRGDPRPPLRKNPQPLASFRIAQRADRLEISGTAPRSSTEGVALKALTVEILRADGEGDFLKLAQKRSITVQPGEPFTEPETLPAGGTVVRVAARAVASGKLSVMTGILTLPVQPPPAPPSELTAVLTADGVRLKWSGKRPNPLPTPEPSPPLVSAAPGPSGTSPSGAPAVGTPAAGTPPPGTTGAPPPAPGHLGPSLAPGAAPPPPAGSATPSVAPAPKAGFWVYRRAKAGRYERPLQAEPTPDKSHLDADAVAGQDWCYVVRAVVSHEPVIESASSNEACLTARDISPPTVPAGLTLLAQPGGLELRWSPSPESDLAVYRVYRAAPTGAPEKIAEVLAGTTVHLDTTATAGTAYRYTITAVDRVGNESAPSAPLLGNLPGGGL
jgi:hypothetical protein